jgi:hypothetical protein
MSASRTSVALIAAFALLLIGSSRRSDAAPASRADSLPGLAARQEALVLDQDITFYQARVARDPEGALDRAKLGALYLQRARQTGSPEDLIRAEQVARESFGLRTRKNAIAASSR